MDPNQFFDQAYFEATVEGFPYSVHTRAGVFLLAQALLDVDASLDATLAVARFLLEGDNS